MLRETNESTASYAHWQVRLPFKAAMNYSTRLRNCREFFLIANLTVNEGYNCNFRQRGRILEPESLFPKVFLICFLIHYLWNRLSERLFQKLLRNKLLDSPYVMYELSKRFLHVIKPAKKLYEIKFKKVTFGNKLFCDVCWTLGLQPLIVYCRLLLSVY